MERGNQYTTVNGKMKRLHRPRRCRTHKGSMVWKKVTFGTLVGETLGKLRKAGAL